MGVLFLLENKITKANDTIAPCKYILDLNKEKCCMEGGNCCGPFDCP